MSAVKPCWPRHWQSLRGMNYDIFWGMLSRERNIDMGSPGRVHNYACETSPSWRFLPNPQIPHHILDFSMAIEKVCWYAPFWDRSRSSAWFMLIQNSTVQHISYIQLKSNPNIFPHTFGNLSLQLYYPSLKQGFWQTQRGWPFASHWFKCDIPHNSSMGILRSWSATPRENQNAPLNCRPRCAVVQQKNAGWYVGNLSLVGALIHSVSFRIPHPNRNRAKHILGGSRHFAVPKILPTNP